MSKEWKRKHFLCYVLLYAASADLVISSEEEAYIIQQVGEKSYKRVKEEFDQDNDSQRINKLVSFSEDEDFDEEYSKIVMNDLEDLFLSDGDYSHWEKSIGRALKRLMNA